MDITYWDSIELSLRRKGLFRLLRSFDFDTPANWKERSSADNATATSVLAQTFRLKVGAVRFEFLF